MGGPRHPARDFRNARQGQGVSRSSSSFLKQRAGNPDNVIEVVCDMSPAFLAAAEETFHNAAVTWTTYVVQIFTKALDAVMVWKPRKSNSPRARWATK